MSCCHSECVLEEEEEEGAKCNNNNKKIPSMLLFVWVSDIPFLYRDAVFKADVMTGGDHAEVWHT